MDTLPSDEAHPSSASESVTPAFGYDAPHSSVRGTQTLPTNALLSAPYGQLRLLDTITSSSLFTLVRGFAASSAQRRDLHGYRTFSIQLDRICDPGWAQHTCHFACSLWPAGVLKPSAHSKAVISGLQSSHATPRRHFNLACFRTYASSAMSPSHLQGSILGLWLAITQTGISPVRTCDIAMPQPRLDPKSPHHIRRCSCVFAGGYRAV